MSDPQQVNRPSARMVAIVTSLFVMLITIFSVVPVLKKQLVQPDAEPLVQNDRSHHSRRKLMNIMQPPADRLLVPNDNEADTPLDDVVADYDPKQATDPSIDWSFPDDDNAWIAGLKWPVMIVALQRHHEAPIGIFVTGSGRFHALSSSLSGWLDRSAGEYCPDIHSETR